jgi:hypothetical protein
VQPGDFVDVKLRCGKVMMGLPARKVLWGAPKREPVRGIVAANDNFENGGAIVGYRRAGEAA